MKLIHSDTLQSLPREVKELIRDGVYALYTLDERMTSFALVTDRGEIYFLSSTGSVAPAPSDQDVHKIGLKEAVAFLDASPLGSARVNVA